MSKKQAHEIMIELINKGKNIFVTGGGGVGKTHSINKVIEHFNEEKEPDFDFDFNPLPSRNIVRTATTGMASLQTPGSTTLHRFLGIGIETDISKVPKICSSSRFEFRKPAIERCSILVIDEVSMLRRDTFEMCDAVLKYVMMNDLPFGGKQIILSGDFMQLIPVVKNYDKKEIKERPWCFQSKIWKELNLTMLNLKKIWRQNDEKFCTELNKIRLGFHDEDTDAYLQEARERRFPSDITPVKLRSTNNMVYKINEEELEKVDAKDEYYTASINGKHNAFKQQVVNDCSGEVNLRLRYGCKVMILINDTDCQYVNGSMGTYKGMDDSGWAVIELLNGNEVKLEKHVWRMADSEGKTLASLRQYPIKLSYAITIHKSQGMSIDYLDVNLGNCFSDGMAYVALSRAKSYEGLRVTSWKPTSVKYNKAALEFYRVNGCL